MTKIRIKYITKLHDISSRDWFSYAWHESSDCGYYYRWLNTGVDL